MFIDSLKAAFQNLKDLPRDLHLIFMTPARLRNLLWRILESCVGILVFATLRYCGLAVLSSALIAVFSEYAIFEFVGEPMEFTGYYWERGPREGEGEPPPDAGWWEE